MIYLDPRGLRKYDHTTLHPMADIEARGRAAAATLGPKIDAICAAQTGADTCVMLYTSGTTGRSKGVVLSNDNIIKTARATVAFDKLTDSDDVLAYLPMAWVGDFIFSMGQAYVAGFCVNCPEGPDTMMADLKEIGPTYYFAPPRIFETLLTDVSIRMEDAGPLKKRMFDYFMAHARKVGADILDGRPVSGADKAKGRRGGKAHKGGGGGGGGLYEPAKPPSHLYQSASSVRPSFASGCASASSGYVGSGAFTEHVGATAPPPVPPAPPPGGASIIHDDLD